MFNPKAPKLNQLALGQRVGKSLRPILAASKRMMSTGTFYKTVKDKFVGVMPARMAKAAALRFAVGTDSGLTDRKEKLALKEMAKAGLLADKYKDGTNYKLGRAMREYHSIVNASAPVKAASSVSEIEGSQETEVDPKIARAKIHQAELHTKMQEDHDAHQAEQDSKATSITRIGNIQTTTSVAHLGGSGSSAVTSVNHLEKRAELPPGPQLPVEPTVPPLVMYGND